MLYSSYGIGEWGKFDRLQKLHFRRQVRHQPCTNNIKYFTLFDGFMPIPQMFG
jgi:hypothetical protein